MKVRKYIYCLIILSVIEIGIIVSFDAIKSSKDSESIKATAQSKYANPVATEEVAIFKSFNTEEEAIVPLSDSVTEDYFKDALFVGDSRMKSLERMWKSKEGIFFCNEGIGVNNLLKKKIAVGNEGDLTFLEVLDNATYNKIYIQLGINDIAGCTMDGFLEKYKEIIDIIRERQPHAIIYIQTIIYVESNLSETGQLYNNRNVESWNKGMLDMAVDKGVYYMNINEVICDVDTNSLKDEYSSDGININEAAVMFIVDYIKSHVI